MSNIKEVPEPSLDSLSPGLAHYGLRPFAERSRGSRSRDRRCGHWNEETNQSRGTVRRGGGQLDDWSLLVPRRPA